MDYEKLYNEARARADKAEKRVKQLEGEVKTSNERAKATIEDLTLHSALIGAGATKKSAKAAILALRGEAKMLDFNDGGEFVFAQFGERTFRNADELAAAFIGRFPNFTQAHEDAVMRANGTPGAPVSFDTMNPAELAALGLDRLDRRGGNVPGRSPQEAPPSSGNPLADQMGAALDKAGY